MKKGIKSYLFYSVFIHIVLISVVLIFTVELGYLTFYKSEKGDFTLVSIYKDKGIKGDISNPGKYHKQVIKKSEYQKTAITDNNEIIKPHSGMKEPVKSKNRYKISKNSSKISKEINIDKKNLLLQGSGDKIKKEVVKGGNENKEAESIKSSATPEYGINPKPEYPLVARRRGYEGEVVFSVQVLDDGNVGEMKMIKTSGYKILDNSAHAALRQWKFVPGKFNGKTVSSWVKVPILFRLNDI